MCCTAHLCHISADAPMQQLVTNVAVSSSPRPWIDVLALTGKFNMAVTERDLDPKLQKMFITCWWLCGLWAEHVDATDSKNTFFRPDYSGTGLWYNRPKKYPTILYGCGWGCGMFQPLGLSPIITICTPNHMSHWILWTSDSGRQTLTSKFVHYRSYLRLTLFSTLLVDFPRGSPVH